jgi:Tfp pilus assembly protein PilF
LAVAAWIAAPAPHAAPFIPENDDVVLERLPALLDAKAVELRRLRERLASTPNDPALAVDLARRYYDLGYRQSDPRYYGYAEAALQPWWKLPDPPADMQLLRAGLLQARHEFDAALDDLTRLLAKDPRNAEAWLMRAVLLMVRADYRGAMASCTPLLHLGKGFQALSCVGGVTLASGKPSVGYRLLGNAYERSEGANPAEKARLLTLLGKAAERMDNAGLAEKHLRAALALDGENAYILAAWADFLLDRERAAEIPAWLEKRTRIDGLLLRLAMAERRLGAPGLDGHVRILQERFEAGRQRGGNPHLGDEARFALHLLDSPEQALRLAVANFASQREYGDLRILLEAALAARDGAAAEPARALIREFKFEDRTLNDLAARIAALPNARF